MELSGICRAQLPRCRTYVTPAATEVGVPFVIKHTGNICNVGLQRYSSEELIWGPAACARRQGSSRFVCEAIPVQKAPKAVTVTFPLEAVPTISGYLPVSDSSRSQLFYVFYEATDPRTSLVDAPLLLWLNGGPGCSSLIGCFYELGPWRFSRTGSLHHNEWAWNNRYGVLFVDSPVGTGFSIASSDDDVPKDQHTIAAHLHHALSSFIAENPSFELRPLFLAGESYAGKYVPSLAHYLINHPQPKNRHNVGAQLMGIVVGNGLTHPRSQVLSHPDVAYCFGLLDQSQKAQCQNMAEEVVALIDRGEWLKAHEARTALVQWIEETSGIATLLDVRRLTKYHHLEDGSEYLAKFLNDANVKTVLKADPAVTWVSCKQSIRSLMAEDTMKSSKQLVEDILEAGYPVLLFQGQYDAKDGPCGSEAWMKMLNWQHGERFWAQTREIWRVNGAHAGYWRQNQNLTHVVFRGAGHQVPHDQPQSSLVMIETWVDQQLKAKQRRALL